MCVGTFGIKQKGFPSLLHKQGKRLCKSEAEVSRGFRDEAERWRAGRESCLTEDSQVPGSSALPAPRAPLSDTQGVGQPGLDSVQRLSPLHCVLVATPPTLQRRLGQVMLAVHVDHVGRTGFSKLEKVESNRMTPEREYNIEDDENGDLQKSLP